MKRIFGLSSVTSREALCVCGCVSNCGVVKLTPSSSHLLPTLVLAMALGVLPSPARSDFLCAGHAAGRLAPPGIHVAAKPAQARGEGIQALVLFAGFRNAASEQAVAPDWASRLFDLDHPGSFSHFYRIVSFVRFFTPGRLLLCLG